MNLKLIVPQKEDLWFKKEMKEDPITMNYNAGYDLNFEGYNRADGTIQTDLKELTNVWAKKWIGNEPVNFYYFIKAENTFIGEFYAKFDKTKNSYEIGIVIKGEYRGNGYATSAIKLLCEKLKSQGIKRLHHKLPASRKSAIKADINNGFVIKEENIDGMSKFGEIEKLVYLEKEL